MARMTGAQYKKALAVFGMTQGQASWLFAGKTKTSGRRWAAEGAPYYVALLLSIMATYDLKPEDIEALGKEWRPTDKKRQRK